MIRAMLAEEGFAAQIDLLRRKFDKDNESILTSAKNEEFDTVVEKADSVVWNLGSVLRSSDGSLVQQFLDVRNDMNILLKRQRNALLTHTFF